MVFFHEKWKIIQSYHNYRDFFYFVESHLKWAVYENTWESGLTTSTVFIRMRVLNYQITVLYFTFRVFFGITFIDMFSAVFEKREIILCILPLKLSATNNMLENVSKSKI